MNKPILINQDKLLQLEERARKLALEKAYLELIIRLMSQVSLSSGLENVVESLLGNILNVIGGTNIILYYLVENEVLYADVYGKRMKLNSINDNQVKKVFETLEPIESISNFTNTQMMTPDFTKSYTWIYPLLIGKEILGVLKMENLHINMRELYTHLPVFFNYTAQILKNEIQNYEQLQTAYEQIKNTNTDLKREISVRQKVEEDILRVNEDLEKRVIERTDELRKTNEQLKIELNERKQLDEKLRIQMDELDRSRKALLSILEDSRIAEENLRLIGLELQTIYDNTYAMFAYLDKDFNFIRVNKAYANADAKSPEFFIGKNHFALYPNEENEKIFRNVVETGKPFITLAKPFDYKEHPEWGVSYWDWSLVPVFGSDEKVSGLIFTLLNVTERKQAEEKLKKTLAEKETLLRELYHRTKNNMSVIISLLELQAENFNDIKLKEAFTESQNRIRTMALVHQKLYDTKDLSHLNLKEYISDLIVLLMKSYSVSERISFVKEMEDVFVLIDTATPCGLVLNELISNALKYAFPENKKGTIKITLQKNDNNEISLLISDNGKGVPSGFNFRTDGNLGMQIIFIIVETQLYGKVMFDASEGVSCRIQFLDNLYKPRV